MSQSKEKQVVIIGGGLGGLAAAIRMQSAGHSVILLEKRHQLGGRASVFTEKGYTFDTGPTIITPPFLINELFESAGKDVADYVELVKVSPKYRLYFSDGTFMNYGGYEDNVEEIKN